ncbi:MAG: hypothetical protein GX130_13295 [Candidatus Hydrogenedens sp.]|jgi:hypothetical protein|nr:hypothetical protein [Candidatus Hydrogenedens sp.]
MAFGDIGGPVTTLVLTCKAADYQGLVDIRKGDAVKLVGSYEVSNKMTNGDTVFGEALEDCSQAGTPIAVRVRGVCTFAFSGELTVPDGKSGIVGTSQAGKVRPEAGVDRRGLILRIRPAEKLMDVLL